MSFTTNKKRQDTMLLRMGEAAELIDDNRYLPWYRSVQIQLEKMGKADEWARMIEVSKTKDTPIFYFRELCKRIKAGIYQFIEKVEDIAGDIKLFIADKIVRFSFGKYQPYWVRRANAFINVNGMAGFIELLEYAERKGISQKYFAQALLNCKSPRQYYQDNVIGARK